MFQYSEHQGCWSKQNTRLIWPLRHSFKSKPVDESSRKKVSLSVGTEGPKMLPRRLFHSDLATHSDGWCSTVELVKPDAITCDMIHQNHMNISSWSMLQFVVWLLIWWHLWHPASSFFIHKSWNPQAPAAYFVGHPPLRHMPPGRKKGQVSTQIWRQEKHMPSNWPKSSLYCPFWLQTRQQQLSVFHGSRQKVIPQIATFLGRWPPNHPPHLLPSSGEASAMGTTSSFLNDVHPEK